MSSYGPFDRPGQGQPRYQPGQQDQQSGSRIGRGCASLIVAIAALTVLLLGAGVAYLFSRGDGDKTASSATNSGAGAASETPGAPSQAEQSDEPVEPGQEIRAGQSATPAPEASAEARFAVKGQCLVNDGTDENPRMRIVTCAAGTYEVLARFDGTTDFKRECAKVKDYQFHYYFDAELEELDYVLCLRRR